MGFPTCFRKISVSLLFTLLSTTTLWAQGTFKQLPDTFWFPVTFFDFHSDGSNPEFECDHASGLYKDMAADSLRNGSIIPEIGTDPYMNRFFKYWYVDWKDSANGGGKGDYYKPFYRVDGGNPPWNAIMKYDSTGRVNHDTSFKNIVIHDSLPFVLIDRDRGLYRFSDSSFYPLDNKGFGVENFNHNYSFTMAFHSTFTYKPGLRFIFRGDDDVWTYINRELALDLGGIHLAVTDTVDTNDLKDLGLTYGSKYNLDFYYAERHTKNSTIMIETNFIQPKLKLILMAEPDITVPEGTLVELKAEVRSEDSIPYPEYSAMTKWTYLYSNSCSKSDLNPDSGATVHFQTHLGYDTILIKGTVFADGFEDSLSDTIKIIVYPGPPCKVWIEPAILNATSSPLELRQKPDPIDTIYIPDGITERDAYGVVRSCMGTFIRMSDSITTNWSAVENIITAEGETGKKFHGVIKRFDPQSRGVTNAIAEEPGLVSDSVPVKIDDFYPVRLRLVPKGGSPVLDYITSIAMETNESEDYEVYAFISTATNPDDPSSYIKLNVKWDLSSPLDSGISPIEPEYSITWTYNPIKYGKGTLTLSNPDDIRTEVLVVPVDIVRSAPDFINIKLLTRESDRIAGKPLRAEVTIKNWDGKVPDQYCFGNDNPELNPSIYQDIMPTGGKPIPTMTVNGVTAPLNTENDTTTKHNQCFMNGVDTVEFVLYYAPRNQTDSLHQITVILKTDSGKVLTASTEKFRIKAAEINRLILTHDPDGLQPITDTIRLNPNNAAKVVYAHGFDQYGNPRGLENSVWNTDGQLQPIDTANSHGKQHTVVHSNPIEEINGNICATAENTTISACAPVIESGQFAKSLRVITRDINGNGFLDRIDVSFSKHILITNNDTSKFSIVSDLTRFPVEAIVPLSGDTVYSLYLKEQATKSPQTDWKPYFSMAGIEGASNESLKEAEDGAAPVVWKITKVMPSKYRKDDVVTIELSEKIQKYNTQNTPDLAFWVYILKSNNQFVKVDLFKGTEVIDFDGNKTIKILMSNGKDINSSNWVNIRYENELIEDIFNNKPDSMNQKVRVLVEPVSPEAEFVPNPFPPSDQVVPGKIILHHDEHAFEKISGGGAVLVIMLQLPNDGSKVFVTLKVYDVAGNLVNFSGKIDVIEDLRLQGIDPSQLPVTLFTLKYFWPGASKTGMKLAPGVYKGVINIDYTNPTYHDMREVKLIGVRKANRK